MTQGNQGIYTYISRVYLVHKKQQPEIFLEFLRRQFSIQSADTLFKISLISVIEDGTNY